MQWHMKNNKTENNCGIQIAVLYAELYHLCLSLKAQTLSSKTFMSLLMKLRQAGNTTLGTFQSP